MSGRAEIVQAFIVLGDQAALARVRRQALTTIEQTRSEHGCVAYALGSDLLDARVVHLYGLWENAEQRVAHAATDHAIALVAAIRESRPIAVSARLYAPATDVSAIMPDDTDAIAAFAPEREAAMTRREKAQQGVRVSMRFSCEAALKRTIEPVRSAVRTVHSERGCIAYHFSRDFDDDCVLRLSEQWTNVARLNDHINSPHMTEFRASSMGLFPQPDTESEAIEAIGFWVEPGQIRDLSLDDV